ncbi:hypothetical protein FALCPG4_012599 [Fusarium falciforme]
MSATFDTDLVRSAGRLVAAEARERGCQMILAPTVCLQRSPLMGRGFEAFGEDPTFSGLMGAAYINGAQECHVAVSLKHFAAHDQSTASPQDDVRASERTLRETHLMPFQLAIKHSDPWSVMASYHRINGVHTSEDPWLLTDLLRKDWGWDGMVVCDWFGLFSTSEALNAGLDLEMPGPGHWRGMRLLRAVHSRKVSEVTIDSSVRNILNLTNKILPALNYRKGQEPEEEGNTQQKRDLCRETARSSVVLLRNNRNILPLDADPTSRQTFGLIGPNAFYPPAMGGGSNDLIPFYVSKPYEALTAVVGKDRVKTAVGCYGHRFSPLLSDNVTVPGTSEPGYKLRWFVVDPDQNADASPIHTMTATQAQMYFADNLPQGVPDVYWLRVTTTYTAPATKTVQLGLCVIGRGRISIDGQPAVDLWTDHPPKMVPCPMFGQASMERTADLDCEVGKQYEISILLKNESVVPSTGALMAGGLRIGCCDKLAPDSVDRAVELAKQVDVPIVIAGLNSDYESEAMDRENLDLPPYVDNLIERCIEANPNTVVITHAGCPIVMPWVDKAETLLHSWYLGQETGNGIVDVLFGRHNPTGRISVTFPRRLEDTPTFLNFGKGTREIYYGEGVFLGHRYYEKILSEPMFWFGYGLSYTTFEYSNLTVPAVVELGEQLEKQTFDVSVDVTNTGSRDGHEIVQLYVQDVECAALRPRKELKAFRKVWVPRGKTVTAKMTLDKYALSYWNEEVRKWHAEKGSFNIIISRSANPKDEVVTRAFDLADDLYWAGV